MALLMLVILYVKSPALFGGTLQFALAVVFLTVFPLLAYPLQPLSRKYKDMGREGQRLLAINFAVAGYVGGCFAALLLRAPVAVWIIYLSYLLSGALVMLSSRLLKFQASGHACGVTGPFALLVYFGQPAAGYLGVFLLSLVGWSSLSMKRHTVSQLVAGAAIPVLALGIVLLIRSLM